MDIPSQTLHSGSRLLTADADPVYQGLVLLQIFGISKLLVFHNLKLELYPQKISLLPFSLQKNKRQHRNCLNNENQVKIYEKCSVGAVGLVFIMAWVEMIEALQDWDNNCGNIIHENIYHGG